MCTSFRPIILLPWRELHYRFIWYDLQTPLDWLKYSYSYQMDVAHVDSSIFSIWQNNLLNILDIAELLINVYCCWRNYKLQVIDKTNSNTWNQITFFIGIPSYTSHILQALRVPVCSSFKSYNCTKFHKLTTTKNVFHAFDVTNILALAYQSSQIIKIIRSDFHKNWNLWIQNWCPSNTKLSEVKLPGWLYRNNMNLSKLLDTYEIIIEKFVDGT